MGTKPLNRKPSLVDRLRQLRTAALAPSKATFMTEKRPSYVPIQPVDEHPAARFRDEEPKKPMSNTRSRSRSYYPEKGLDLEELDFKLEQYAKKSLESTETETDSEADGPPGRDTSGMQQMQDQASTAETSDDEPERDPSSCLEPVASLQPPSQAFGNDESCLLAPQQASEDSSQPSDYELFMREAEEAERQRMEDKDKPSRPIREPPLNHFYSNNWDHQAQPVPGLAEIQEVADDDARGSHEAHASSRDQDSDRQALSSEASSEKGVVNIAPPKSTISRANTDLTGGARHIKFSNACVPRDRIERRASAPSCATRVKSPSRPVRKQKSIKQLIADYIRPPRG